MNDIKFKEMKQDRSKELIAEFIVNSLGINLCSVDSIEIDRQDDGQIKDIHIKFIPAKR